MGSGKRFCSLGSEDDVEVVAVGLLMATVGAIGGADGTGIADMLEWTWLGTEASDVL
jgi:hypothetical protein